jgi:glycosyltransferase involved in cell wall biosynthesis
VIVPARDAAPTLERTLVALAAQKLDSPYEVIVVDDGSTDETPAIAARHAPLVTLVQVDESRGPGGARNRGVAIARAEVLAFTDADCFPTPDWLAEGLAAVAKADLVQGRVAPDPLAERRPFDRTVVVDRERGFYQTANLLVRRETFEAVGGFRDWVLEEAPDRSWSPDRRRGRSARTPIGEDTQFAWAARRLRARTAFAGRALVHHAVVPGGLRDELADRWHWARDMPGLAREVPELRTHSFYRRWFFHARTSRFDLAVASLVVALGRRRPVALAGALPYLRWVAGEAAAWSGPANRVRFALGSIVLDAATLGGLLVGSISWRSPLF